MEIFLFLNGEKHRTKNHVKKFLAMKKLKLNKKQKEERVNLFSSIIHSWITIDRIKNPYNIDSVLEFKKVFCELEKDG